MNSKVFFEKCLKELSKEKIILDIGGGHPFQKDMAPYKNLFKNCNYLTVDQAIYKPSIIADIHNLPIEDQYADGAICKAVLEHVHNPFEVVDEIHRVLKKNGKLLVWLPFIYPYHGANAYKDYYRYTEDGVKYLFRNFHNVQIVPSAGFFETIIRLIPFFNKFWFLGRGLDRIVKVRNQYSGFYLFCIK